MKKTSYKVLVIEDEPDIRELIEFNLKKYDYNVLLANNGEKGLKDNKGREYIFSTFLLIDPPSK